MKAEELRIGNLVYEGGNYPENITEVSLGDFYNMHKDNTCPFEGIHLTEKIITEWCGMKIHDLDSRKYLENCIGVWAELKNEFHYVVDSHPNDFGDWSYSTVKVEFLHDLQNLFYYHNNKNELTIKSK